jgi:hypothetical protein
MKLISMWRCLAVLLPALAATAQPRPVEGVITNPRLLKDAVILIVRHAEPADSGPGLSVMGERRAAAYVQYFRNFAVNGEPLKLNYLFAAADTESSRRPRLTLEPLGQALGLKIKSKVKNRKFQELAEELQSLEHRKHVLICWHHGEIPELLEALGADPAKLLPGGKWPDKEFGWVLQLRYNRHGRLMSRETKRINENLALGG